MKRTIRHGGLILLLMITAACATEPPLTPSQLASDRLAAVYVASTALWKIAAPPGQGYRMEITHVNGHGVCTPTHCPTRVTLPAGSGEFEVRCSLLMGDLQIPKQSVNFHGNFIAGHMYQLRPVSMVPACRFEVRDATHDPD
jgi:hypothetical protein